MAKFIGSLKAGDKVIATTPEFEAHCENCAHNRLAEEVAQRKGPVGVLALVTGEWSIVVTQATPITVVQN